MPADKSLIYPYQSPIWLPGGHLQTIVPSLFARVPEFTYQRERWELADGDFIDVDWALPEKPPSQYSKQPLVAVFHGLEGNSQSQYAKAVMRAVIDNGWSGVVIHFRGCSGELNRLPRLYYAGDSEDMQLMLTRLAAVASGRPIYAVGFSLGGNALLKWLGEHAQQARKLVAKAAAICAPIDLEASAIALDKGINRFIYTPMFVASIKSKAMAFSERHPGLLEIEKVMAARTIHAIDNAVTAVLYGAQDAKDYYAKNMAKPWLSQIPLPTLIINAKNDPFLPANYLPTKSQVSSEVRTEYTKHGGHLGFMTAPFPGSVNWLPNRLIRFFESAD